MLGIKLRLPHLLHLPHFTLEVPQPPEKLGDQPFLYDPEVVKTGKTVWLADATMNGRSFVFAGDPLSPFSAQVATPTCWWVVGETETHYYLFRSVLYIPCWIILKKDSPYIVGIQ